MLAPGHPAAEQIVAASQGQLEEARLLEGLAEDHVEQLAVARVAHVAEPARHLSTKAATQR